jgi:hypothetical protein
MEERKGIIIIIIILIIFSSKLFNIVWDVFKCLAYIIIIIYIIKYFNPTLIENSMKNKDILPSNKEITYNETINKNNKNNRNLDNTNRIGNRKLSL